MDFKKYYSNQTEGVAGFNGNNYQRGYGIGSMFKKFVRWIIPIIKNNAVPYLNKSANIITDNISNGLSQFYNDIEDPNQDINKSAKERFSETFQNIKKDLQKGRGKTSVKRLHNKKKKISNNKFSSIFD